MVSWFVIEKGEVTKVPVWVKMHNVPLLAYSDVGLSLIATQIGKPIMLDAFTSSMCVESLGIIGFAQALIEVSSDFDLKKEVIMAIPNEEGNVYIKEVTRVEYEWKPPHCVECTSFGHALLHTLSVLKRMFLRLCLWLLISLVLWRIKKKALLKPKDEKESKDMEATSNLEANGPMDGSTSQPFIDKPSISLKNSFEALENSSNFFDSNKACMQTLFKWTEDFESDDEVDEVLFLEGNKFDDQFDIRLKGRVRK
ncbi:reverse transcriptase domain-containing protein [Tanacetum coccineum]